MFYQADNMQKFASSSTAVLLFLILLNIALGGYLSLYYQPNEALAFESIENMVRGKEHAWVIQYLHNLLSKGLLLTAVVCLVMQLLTRNNVWLTAISASFNLVLLIALMHSGLVLPWGQQAFSLVAWGFAGSLYLQWLWHLLLGLVLLGNTIQLLLCNCCPNHEVVIRVMRRFLVVVLPTIVIMWLLSFYLGVTLAPSYPSAM